MRQSEGQLSGVVPTMSVGLMMISGHPSVAKRRVAITAAGVVDVIPKVPIYILVTNFSERRAHLPKHMLVAVGEEPPQ